MAQKIYSKNFILLILGQASSLFGNFILKLALSMYVLEVTGSAAVFAGILSAAAIPTILLSPLGGILADRANRRNIMVALDALSGVSVLCAALLFSENNALAVISALLVILSVLGAFETPTVQACVPQMLTGDTIIKGNAIVNQIASLAYLIAPILGSLLYTVFGLKPVMLASVGCFFLTALFECFIKLSYLPPDYSNGILSIIKQDFSVSIRYIFREQPGILKMLLFAALARFFVIGTVMVGLPYIVRSILGLSAEHYGAAESALAIATILGSAAAGFLTGKLKTRRLSLVLTALGGFVIPAGIAFLFPAAPIIQYGINVAAFCGMQIAVSIFSIFAVSVIQQQTPNRLIGKVMAYTSTITMCVQPLGQILYGFLFDGCRDAIYLVLIPTGALICGLGLLSSGFFYRLEQSEHEKDSDPAGSV